MGLETEDTIAHIVIVWSLNVAEDASENTKKKFRNMCTYYEVPLYFLSDKESLGRAMGKEFRASLAVQDENFAKAIMKALEKESGR